MNLTTWTYALAISLLLAGSTSARAGEMSSSRYAREVREQQEKELEGIVEVSFRIDARGKVQILHINATSPQLADYVIKKLNRIQLEKGDPQIGQVIKYRFVFKKQA